MRYWLGVYVSITAFSWNEKLKKMVVQTNRYLFGVLPSIFDQNPLLFLLLFRFDNLEGTPKYQYPKYENEGVLKKYKYGGDKIWRHLAFQLDETAGAAKEP